VVGGGGFIGGGGEEQPKIPWEPTEIVKKARPEAQVAQEGAKKTTARKPAVTGRKAAQAPSELVTLDIVDKSSDSKKPVLLFFSDGTRDSLTMEKLVLDAKGIVEFAAKFHASKVDAKTADKNVLATFGVKVTPAIVLADFQGKVLGMFAKRTTAKDLLSAMKVALAKNEAAVKKAVKAEKEKADTHVASNDS